MSNSVGIRLLAQVVAEQLTMLPVPAATLPTMMNDGHPPWLTNNVVDEGICAQAPSRNEGFGNEPA